MASLSLPNFLVVGAAKSGTTAIYEYIRQHPQIYLTPLKETNFFALDGTPPRFAGPRADILNRDALWRIEDYRRQFQGVTTETAIGEVCPRYLFTPGTPARILRRLPDVRIIAILRNPADRAFSGYSMYRRDGLEQASTLAAALADEPRRIRDNWAYGIHRQYGFYGAQLAEYYDYFPPEHIRCYLYDDFNVDPVALLSDLFHFIGVDPSFEPDMTWRPNRSGMIRNPLLRFLWTRTHHVRGALPLLPKSVRRKAAAFFTNRPMQPLPFPDDVRQELLASYRDDIRRLECLIGRDLRHWLTGESSEEDRRSGLARARPGTATDTKGKSEGDTEQAVWEPR